MINENRLKDLFARLVRIDSVSGKEGAISREIRKLLESMGADILIDDSGRHTGSETGNLIARFKGNRSAPPLFFNAHMDTVEPGKGVNPIFEAGVFRSDGTTILGADDKSAIAIIIEAMKVILDNNLPHGPIEVVLTTCEEIGLLGARYLDYSLLNARYGYALDTFDTDSIITKAPAANHFQFTVYGKSAHAGAEPEKGINAIRVAATAISGLTLGRIDSETTCNIGFIECSGATNIVPEKVHIKGEARSHSASKLAEVTREIVASFENAVANSPEKIEEEGLPKLTVEVESQFPNTFIPEDHRVVTIAKKAAENQGRTLVSKKTGGGSDANIFFSKNIVTGVIGTGMRDAHTVRENIRLADMVKTASLLIEIISVHAGEEETAS
jgi:tripeptide aminopeptidase